MLLYIYPRGRVEGLDTCMNLREPIQSLVSVLIRACRFSNAAAINRRGVAVRLPFRNLPWAEDRAFVLECVAWLHDKSRAARYATISSAIPAGCMVGELTWYRYRQTTGRDASVLVTGEQRINVAVSEWV